MSTVGAVTSISVDASISIFVSDAIVIKVPDFIFKVVPDLIAIIPEVVSIETLPLALSVNVPPVVATKILLFAINLYVPLLILCSSPSVVISTLPPIRPLTFSEILNA